MWVNGHVRWHRLFGGQFGSITKFECMHLLTSNSASKNLMFTHVHKDVRA